MARILTGIQSSGKPHLGNLIGAIEPAINLSKDTSNQSYFFIADMHALTTIKDAAIRRENTTAVAAAWIAMGFDMDKQLLYRQSKIPFVTELAWYLSCYAPYPMLANAHSFKDKANKLSDVNVGIFTYPVLMACDILMYDADIVPVGKDQKQHLEITRDIAKMFNRSYGDTFVVPTARISEQTMMVPGTDGQKMSKSYGNTIDVFQSEKPLLKKIKEIITDSTPLEQPKNPNTCNVFKLYQLLGNKDQTEDLRKKYLNGNYGYGHAKKALFELIMDKFEEERQAFNRLMKNPKEIEHQLEKGEKKAAKVGSEVLDRVKSKLGFT